MPTSTQKLTQGSHTFSMIDFAGCCLLPGQIKTLAAASMKVATTLKKVSDHSKHFVLAPSPTRTTVPVVGCLVEVLSVNSDTTTQPIVIAQGLSRVCIDEIDTEQNCVSCTKFFDFYPPSPTISRITRRTNLLTALAICFPKYSQHPMISTTLECELQFGALCDLLAGACELSLADYVRLLNERNVDARSELVLELLCKQRQRGMSDDGFPPPFSWN